MTISHLCLTQQAQIPSPGKVMVQYGKQLKESIHLAPESCQIPAELPSKVLAEPLAFLKGVRTRRCLFSCLSLGGFFHETEELFIGSQAELHARLVRSDKPPSRTHPVSQALRELWNAINGLGLFPALQNPTRGVPLGSTFVFL